MLSKIKIEGFPPNPPLCLDRFTVSGKSVDFILFWQSEFKKFPKLGGGIKFKGALR